MILAVMAIAAIGMGAAAGALNQKQLLEAKKYALVKENERLRQEIKMLERDITSMRDNPRAVEKAAESKLGMARPEDTVYVFESNLIRKDSDRIKMQGVSAKAKTP